MLKNNCKLNALLGGHVRKLARNLLYFATAKIPCGTVFQRV